MLTVKLVKQPEYSPEHQKLINLGMPIPKIGNEYTVAEYLHFKDLSKYPKLLEKGLTEYKGYILETCDWRDIGITLDINHDCFEIVKDEFIPNKFVTTNGDDRYVEERIIHINTKMN